MDNFVLVLIFVLFVFGMAAKKVFQTVSGSEAGKEIAAKAVKKWLG